jgi:RNA polymerase sporulation-specific sigma factor
MGEYNDPAVHRLLERAREGDEEATGLLVDKNLGLVWSVVRRFGNRGCEPEDLFQIGSIGLIKAIRNFDPSFEVMFSTYAVPMIAGEIKRFLRDDGPVKVSRSIKELYAKVRGTMDIMGKELGREPSIGELAERLNVEREDITLALESSVMPESLYSVVNESEPNPIFLIDKIAQPGELDNSNGEEQIIDKLAISQILNKLPPNERQIITLRYFKELTQTKIAEIMGISQVQVSRMEKRILKKLKAEINLN